MRTRFALYAVLSFTSILSAGPVAYTLTTIDFPLPGPNLSITRDNDIHKDRMPRWSPDGKQIAFFPDRSGKFFPSACSGDMHATVPTIAELRQAEVEDLDQALVIDPNIAGFDVAMSDACGVRG